ncbi:MAG: serine/threonine protein kinase [Polyangiaceae bacterium]|nr:serine/threonine protein kinase [Polyangiaceae bacterium]
MTFNVEHIAHTVAKRRLTLVSPWATVGCTLLHSAIHVHPGDLISGKYRLLRQLGRGGMGSVWAARNELTDRDFAMKFLLPELAKNRDALHRFFLEARACGQIKHPAVVSVYDMGQAEDGTPYLVMELMEGEGLDQRLARSGVFRPGEAAACVAFVARGLEEAHVRGLVHRDLKPGNVFFAVDDRGEVIPKVLDFGVSKATAAADPKFVRTNTGAVLGSPAYMSPEQARGDESIDGRSDVWSLGVILYETLTGRSPFDGNNYNQLMVNIITQPHKPVMELNPIISQELSDVVDRCLEKDPARRVRTARELADRLEDIASRITGTPYPGMQFRKAPVQPLIASPTPTETWVEVAPTKRESKLFVWMSGAVFVAAVLAIGALAVVRSAPPQVDIAGRGAALMRDAKARVDYTLNVGEPTPETKPEGSAPAPSVSPSTTPTAAPSTSASAAPSAAPSATVSTHSDSSPSTSTPSGSTAATTTSAKPLVSGKKTSNRPPPAHGGVTSPGF